MASEKFEVWRGGREVLLGGFGRGPEKDWAVDPLYEDMDCPMFVDFTQPDTIQEEDLNAWFDIYVDREAGKPRSYPLFRDPAMDIALYEMEVERLIKAAQTHAVPQLQPEHTSLDRHPSRRRYNSGSSLSSSSSSPPSAGRCSPNSVLGPRSPRASKPSLAPGKGFGVIRPLDPTKPSEPRVVAESREVIRLVADARGTSEREELHEARAAFGGQAPVFGIREVSETSVPYGSRAVPEYIALPPETRAPSRLRLGSALSRKVGPNDKRSEAGELWEQRKAFGCITAPNLVRGLKGKRPPEPRETFRPSESPRVSTSPTNKRYMLPTATSIQKQSPKPTRPQQPSADVADTGPGWRPKWRLPSPRVRRATLRPVPKTEPEPGVSAPPSSATKLGDPMEQSVLKKLVMSEVKGKGDLRKSWEERKARFKEVLKSVGTTWQQPVGSSASHKEVGVRMDERRQAQWVLAL